MQQQCGLTIQAVMRVTGVDKFQFFTCPVCGEAISSRPASTTGHLSYHAVHGEFPSLLVPVIRRLLDNKRGVNAYLAANYPSARIDAARECVAWMKQSQKGREKEDIERHNFVNRPGSWVKGRSR